MEKLMEPVSRLDVIKAFTLMQNPQDLRVIHIRDNKWSADNSGQIAILIKGVTSTDIQKVGNYKIASRERIEVFPSGYYVCTYGEKLDLCEYSIEVIYRLQGITEVAYLYYIGQDNH